MEKLASKYANFISTMNAGKSDGRINVVKKVKICKHCGEEGHHIRDCAVRLKANQARKNKDIHNDSEEEEDEECGYCNRPGHKEEECFTKKRAMKKKNAKKSDEDKEKNTKDEDAAGEEPKSEGKVYSAKLIAELNKKLEEEKQGGRR